MENLKYFNELMNNDDSSDVDDDNNKKCDKNTGSTNNIVNVDRKRCLISNEMVNKKYGIQLHCGHFFRYHCLFQEYWVNKSFRTTSKSVRCPYCRRTQKGILPYKAGYEKIEGLNYPETRAMKTQKCEFISEKGKRKGEVCGKYSNAQYCKKCSQKMEKIKEKKLQEKEKGKDIANVHNKPKVDLVPFTSCLNVLKSGKRKGELCMRKCQSGTSTCGIHKKNANLPNNQNEKVIISESHNK